MTAEQVIAACGSEKVRPEWRPLREGRYRGDGKKSTGPTQNVLGFYSLGIDSFDAPRTPGNVLEAAFEFSEESPPRLKAVTVIAVPGGSLDQNALFANLRSRLFAKYGQPVDSQVFQNEKEKRQYVLFRWWKCGTTIWLEYDTQAVRLPVLHLYYEPNAGRALGKVAVIQVNEFQGTPASDSAFVQRLLRQALAKAGFPFCRSSSGWSCNSADGHAKADAGLTGYLYYGLVGHAFLVLSGKLELRDQSGRVLWKSPPGAPPRIDWLSSNIGDLWAFTQAIAATLRKDWLASRAAN
jgi:hypothetical protein